MHTSKSTSGIWVQISGPCGTRFPISWSSGRQQATSRSTTEAESVALSDGLFCETLAVQDLLMKISGSAIKIRISEDSDRVMKVLRAGYSVKLRGLSRTQRLSIASVSLHLKEHEDEIELLHTPSKDQLGDLMTKSLARPLFEDLRSRIGMTEMKLVDYVRVCEHRDWTGGARPAHRAASHADSAHCAICVEWSAVARRFPTQLKTTTKPLPKEHGRPPAAVRAVRAAVSPASK